MRAAAGVCVHSDMPCGGIMKPALIVMGALVVGIGLTAAIRSWGREQENT